MSERSQLAAVRADYRRTWLEVCETAAELDRWPDDSATHTHREDRARLEALEFDLRWRIPLSPDELDDWPGGWMPGRQVHALRHGRQPDVHPTEHAAVAAGLDPLQIVWTPMCRATDGGRLLLLDAEYWSDPASDPLTGTDHGLDYPPH